MWEAVLEIKVSAQLGASEGAEPRRHFAICYLLLARIKPAAEMFALQLKEIQQGARLRFRLPRMKQLENSSPKRVRASLASVSPARKREKGHLK